MNISFGPTEHLAVVWLPRLIAYRPMLDLRRKESTRKTTPAMGLKHDLSCCSGVRSRSSPTL